MLKVADIEDALRRQLPAELHSVIPALAHSIADVAAGGESPAGATGRLFGDPALADAWRALAGRTVKADTTVISFGAGNQIGTVTIHGHVAGRDVYAPKIQIDELNYYNRSYTNPVRTPHEIRSRRVALNIVRSIWIDNFLDIASISDVRVDLTLIDRVDLVHRPADEFYQERIQRPRVLVAGVPIVAVFDQSARGLLILGEPGSGKTMLLLELLRDLLQRADQDQLHPTPVVLPLANWATEQKPIKEWIVDQLARIYQVPRDFGRKWVATNDILPLFDGLDEVTEGHRTACIEALNAYQHTHLTSLAVCARIREYNLLEVKLQLQRAIEISPLTLPQSETYLALAEVPLERATALIQDDEAFQELAKTPLMLHVMAVVFKEEPLVVQDLAATVEERQRQLWDRYITIMLKRRRRQQQYTPAQALTWLRWLADQMLHYPTTRRAQPVRVFEWLVPYERLPGPIGRLIRWQLDYAPLWTWPRKEVLDPQRSKHAQDTFYVEWMQPTWLRPVQRRLFPVIVVATATLLTMIAAVVGFAFTGQVFLAIGMGLLMSMVNGLFVLLTYRSSVIRPISTLHWSWEKFREQLRFVLGISSTLSVR